MKKYISKIEQKENEAVIAGLKQKGLNWFKPWRGADGAICHPINWNTGRAYRGTNVWLLNAVMMTEGYEHNEWLTAKQGYAAGGTNKGENDSNVSGGHFGAPADRSGRCYIDLRTSGRCSAQVFLAVHESLRGP